MRGTMKAIKQENPQRNKNLQLLMLLHRRRNVYGWQALRKYDTTNLNDDLFTANPQRESIVMSAFACFLTAFASKWASKSVLKLTLSTGGAIPFRRASYELCGCNYPQASHARRMRSVCLPFRVD